MKKLIKFIPLIIIGITVIYISFSGFSKLFPNDDKTATAEDSIPKPENYITHTSNEYSFKHPKIWNVKDTREGARSFVLTTIKNYNDEFYTSSSNPPATNNLSKITIAKVPKDIDQSFQNWLNDYVARGQADWGTKILSKESRTVDNHDAIFQMEQLGKLPSPVMYINRDTFVYIIIGGSFNPALDDVFHRLVADFSFSQ